MDFQKIKQEAEKLKQKASQVAKNATDYSAGKLADSRFTLRSIKEFEEFIKKSETTHGTDSATGKKKDFSHRVIIIFGDTKNEFFTNMLYGLPVLVTKAFSQNISLKLADISMKDLDKSTYNIKADPCLLVFENMKVIKTLEGEESIQKVVKSLNLDINATIDSL